MINVVAMKRQDCSVEKYRNSVTKNTNGTAIGTKKNKNGSLTLTTFILYKETLIILSNFIMSFSRDCIHVNDLCDGVEQCADGSDEDPSICTSSNELPIRLVDPDAAESGLENVRLGRVEVKYKVKIYIRLVIKCDIFYI